MARTSIEFDSEWTAAAKDTFNVEAAIQRAIGGDGPEIGCIGEHFQNNLLTVIERPVSGAIIVRHRLTMAAHDTTTGCVQGVLEQLGSIEHVSLSVGQFIESLRLMRHGTTQFAYVRSGRGQYYGLHAAWNQVYPKSVKLGIFIESGKLNRPYPWAKGAYVVSRSPSFATAI